ncbi:MAG: T9SS type A sorting domain-containing protein [Flavobacteriales bacterium]|nr:T9SS type A sorting domain-containing protein [Flavobacteriales bacterium]
MKKIFTLLALLLIISAGKISAQSGTPMYVVSPYNDSLWQVDTTTWKPQLPGIAIAIAGSTATGCNGLAVQPCTGAFYTMAKVSGVTGRMLCKLNVNSGVLTPIGNTGDNIAGIAFMNDTTLVGITGDGGTVPETLYYIDLVTAATTLIGSNGQGSDGEAIGYCPDNNKIYEWSGRDTNPGMIEWTPDSSTSVVVTRTGFNYDEVFGAVYLGGGEFLLANLDQEFIIVDTSGFAVKIDSLADGTPVSVHDYYKGMAFATTSLWLLAGAPDTICPLGDTTWMAAFAQSASSFQWYLDGVMIPGATNDTVAGYFPGEYTCEIVTPQCGATLIGTSVTIQARPIDTAMISPISPLICPGDSVLLSDTSGFAGPSQWWLGGSIINSTTSAFAQGGLYTYRLYAPNGCYGETDVDVIVDLIGMTFTSLPVICNGDSSGVATVVTSGGVGPLTYSWSTGETGLDELSLSGGTHYLTITDSIGCASMDSVLILEPAAIDISLTTEPMLCSYDDSTGTALSTIVGGVGTLTYMWSTGETGPDEMSLSAGTHYLTVTDSSGCTSIDSVVVLVPSPITGSITGTNETGTGNNGATDLTASGGTGGYSYDWNNDGTGDFDDSEDLSGLTAGTYIVVVMDANGCLFSDTVTIISTVGMDEFGIDANMKIYPNPNTGHFFVELSNISTKNLKMQVYSVDGKLLFDQAVSTTESRLILLSLELVRTLLS